MSEQGKPEPQPITREQRKKIEALGETAAEAMSAELLISHDYALTVENHCRDLAEAAYDLGAASQPLVPPTEMVWCVFTADSDAQYLQAVLRSEDDAQAYIAAAKIRDAERRWLDSWDIEAWKVEPLEPLVPQQEPTSALYQALDGLIQAISEREDKHGERFAPEILHACAVGEAALKVGVPSEQGTPPQETDFREWAKLMLYGLRVPGSEKLDSGLPHAAQKAFMEAELKSFANSFASSSQGTGWVSVEGDEFEEMALTWMRKHFKLIEIWWHGYESPTVSGVTFLRQFLQSDEYRKWARPTPPSGEKT